jgi:hypothetical protein
MKTSGRLYYDKFQHLVSCIGTLDEKVRSSEKNAIDANWMDAGSIDYISRLVEKAIAELDGG